MISTLILNKVLFLKKIEMLELTGSDNFKNAIFKKVNLCLSSSSNKNKRTYIVFLQMIVPLILLRYLKKV